MPQAGHSARSDYAPGPSCDLLPRLSRCPRPDSLRSPDAGSDRAGDNPRQCSPCATLDFCQACPVRRFELSIERFRRFAGGHEEIAVEALEAAIDRFFADDCLDALDRRRMALRHQPCAVLSVEAFDFEVAIV